MTINGCVSTNILFLKKSILKLEVGHSTMAFHPELKQSFYFILLFPGAYCAGYASYAFIKPDHLEERG